jgi:Ca2+-binding RTX toxin-like protein
MATLPSAFYGDYAAGADLSFLLANVPPGEGPNYLFDKVVGEAPIPVGTGTFFTGSNKDEIFYIENGDYVKGGKGYDAVVQSAKDGLLGTLNLQSSVESGLLSGDLNGDILGNAKDNNLVGNAGDNFLKGGSGKDVLIGNDGNDTLVGDKGKDILSGGEGNDSLFGGTGRDKLWGFAGDDDLFGGGGKDSLIGGVGNDTLFGGGGKDRLTGEAGEDVFGFLKDQKGIDVITDFEAGIDKIDLTDFGTDFSKLKFQNDGDDVIVTVGSGENAVKFKLLGYQAGDINGSFFQF